jgi:hypothetical protein
MNKGMLWFDNNKKTSLTEKVQAAAKYYQEKYGTHPTLCLVNPSMLADKPTVDVEKITVRPYRPVLPGHMWIGFDDTVTA